MRITRRYLACCTRRITSTTMVFSIFALVTLPISSVRSPRSAAVFCVSAVIPISSRLLQFLCSEQRLHPRQIFFGFAQPLQRFRLPGGQLKSQPEDGLRQFLLLRFKFVDARFTNLFNAP